MHGDIAPLAMKNTVRGVAEGSIIPVEILSRKARLSDRFANDRFWR